ncbi:hypothetical protein ABS767_12735 [Sphingomonas sp. ST-64]|uniref:MORN repeat-containing protein n=1 Tax=Sphingomonas plantiphila TaxID=3163295 RepID=A0ABW8YRX3_9SPHN
MHTTTRSALAMLALLGGTAVTAGAASAQSYPKNYFLEQAHWIGTWRTNFGEVKLKAAGSTFNKRYFYGQYGSNNWIVGWTSDRGRIMRGFFQRTDGNKAFGTFEWHMDYSGRQFTGGWQWGFDPNKLPRAVAGTWTGRAQSAADPATSSIVPLLVQRGTAPLPSSNAALRGVFNNWTRFAGSGANSFLEFKGPKVPTQMEVKLVRVAPFQPDRNPAIFGIAGVYLSCSGGGRIAPSSGNNRLFDIAEANARAAFQYGNIAPRVTFTLPQACLHANKPLTIQLQTNLKERDPVRNDALGYQAVVTSGSALSSTFQYTSGSGGKTPTNNYCRNQRSISNGWLFDCFVVGNGEIANVQFEMNVR